MKTLTVFKHEFIKTFLSRSFLIGLFLIPVVSFIVMLIITNVQSRNQSSASPGKPSEKVEIQGFIDQSGFIQTIPVEIKDELMQYPDFQSAVAAVERSEISSFYIIPMDYIAGGVVDVYRLDFNPIGGISASGNFTQLLNANLLKDDPDLLDRIKKPFELTFHYISQKPRGDSESSLAFFVPYAVTILFYIFVLGSASMLLNSITKEKENRVMEILLTSVNPTEMLAGKILALGLIGLLQTITWLGAGWLMLQYLGRTALISVAFQLPATILAWGVIFFLLGYTIYASIMAGIGVLVNNLRESSQATLLVMVPLLIPMMLIYALIEKTNSLLSIGLSLFPLTAPVAMMARLAAAEIPIWQPIVAVTLLVLTAIVIVRAVAGMFRAQNLLTGQGFNLRVFIQALLGRM